MKSFTRTGRTVAAVVVVVGAFACSRGAAGQQAGAQQPAQPPSAQQQPTAQQPAAASATLITASAKVRKIDKANGLVTLQVPQGQTFDVKAGPDVDLNKLKIGDTVKATYYAEVAVSIAKASAGAPKITATAVQRGGVTAMQSTMTARIISVDPSKNLLVIRGPLGAEHTLKVDDPDLQARLKQMKPGESFDVTYTQAVAVSLQPSTK